MKKIFSVLPCLFFLVPLLFLPAESAAAVKGALELCLYSVIPSLFFFFVTSALLAALDPSPGIGGILLLGLVCGYPVGAKQTLAARRGGMPKSAAERILALSCFPSPGFLGAFFGKRLYGTPAAGLLLWAICAASILLCGALLLPREKAAPRRLYPPPRPFFSLLIQSIRQAARDLFSVCSLILFFSAFSSLLLSLLPPLPEVLSALLFGAAEMTTGLSLLSAPSPLSAAVSAAFCTFGGACVLSQISLFARQEALSLRPLLKVRLFAVPLAAGAAYGLFALLF